MFRIRRIFDDRLAVNRGALDQVQGILSGQFSGLTTEEIESLGAKLRDPFRQRFRSILFVAENRRRKVLGFALVLHETRLRFCYLDYVASSQGMTSRGIGGALYEYVRDEARALGCKGVFFECLPDEAEQCHDPAELRQAKARLSFYEHYGARPIIGTNYQRKVKPEDTCMPYLVFDGLGSSEPLRPAYLRKVVRVVLERKYAELCPPSYVRAVVRSIKQDPVALRPLRYVRDAKQIQADVARVARDRIALVVNDKHDIHHVHDRGYVEAPVRIPRILQAIEVNGTFERVKVRHHPRSRILAVHDADFVSFLQRTCAGLEERRSVYPYVFPIRNQSRPPKERSVRAGYYCIDTFTPLNANAWLAARRAVDCVLTAADQLIAGRRLTYALVRPPGHHVERRTFGGFCYLNNNAVAAQRLSELGRVAILDVDYHHGNGQQDIFYQRADMLTVSIHGHPDFAYPYFSGFAEEQGDGDGLGANLNLPMRERVDGARYQRTLGKALDRIREHRPDFLVVALGLDTARQDPTGSWSLTAADLRMNGMWIGHIQCPILVVQEGGYRTRTLGANAAAFFDGLVAGARP